MTGVDGVDLAPGEYTVVASEWQRDVGMEKLGDVTSGTEDGEAMWHTHDVEDEQGTTVLEILEDRRAMEGLSPSGRQFLFRSPGGEELMAWKREGYTPWAAGTLLAADDDAQLARWTQSVPYVGNWTLDDGDGEPVATAKRRWSLSTLWYPGHTLESPGGEEFGTFEARRSGLFYHVDVGVREPVIPTEVAIALAYGVSWALTNM